MILSGKWEDGTRPKDIYTEYISENRREYLPVIIDGLGHGDKRVQNGCSELASLIAIDEPKLIYPYLDLFIEKLDAKAPVQRWEAVNVIGLLAKVDTENSIPEYIPLIIPFLEEKSIVLANYAAQSLSMIAKEYPESAENIFDTLIAKSPLFTDNKIGFIIEYMTYFMGYESLRPRIRNFVEPYTRSEIGVVKRKARKTVKELDKQEA